MKDKVDNRNFQFCSKCSDDHIRVGDTLCIDTCNEIHCCAICGFSSEPNVNLTVSLKSERLDDGKYDRENDNSLGRYVYDYKILEDCDLSKYQGTKLL